MVPCRSTVRATSRPRVGVGVEVGLCLFVVRSGMALGAFLVIGGHERLYERPAHLVGPVEDAVDHLAAIL